MDSKSIGKQLKMRREELGLDRADVAAYLEMTPTGYGYYETGARDISATQLYVLAQFLRCPIGYFFVEDTAGNDLTEENALAYYRGIPPDLKPAARAVLKTMFEQADRDETTHGKRAE